MRPARSWCFTSAYFCRTFAPVVSLRRGDAILDHLEHVRIRRQREHAHHEAADARRDDEAVARMREMVQEVAVEEVLAGLLQPDHRVQLGRGLVGQHHAQEVDVRRRHFHVDEEVRAVGGEQERELDVVHQQRVDVQAAVGGVLQRAPRTGASCMPLTTRPDGIRRLVAEEQRRQHLDLVVRLEAIRPRRAARGRPRAGCARSRAEVREAASRSPKSSTMSISAWRSAVRQRVVAAVRGRVGFDVLGGHRRAHEDEAVVEVRRGAGSCTTPS